MQECFFPLLYKGMTIIIPIDKSICTHTPPDYTWLGGFPKPDQLGMTEYETGFYYGILGILCAYAFVHHIRSV